MSIIGDWPVLQLQQLVGQQSQALQGGLLNNNPLGNYGSNHSLNAVPLAAAQQNANAAPPAPPKDELLLLLP